MADLLNSQSQSNEKARQRGKLPNAGNGRSVWFTHDEWITVERAVAGIRLGLHDPTITEGRALELLCADALSGAG